MRNRATSIEQRYTVMEVAGLLRLHPVTVRRLVSRGAMESERWGAARRIRASAVERYAAGLRSGGSQA